MLRSHAQQARAAAPTCVQQVEAAGVAGALARGLKVVGRRQPALPLAQLLQLLSRACMLVYGMRQCACMRGQGSTMPRHALPCLLAALCSRLIMGLAIGRNIPSRCLHAAAPAQGPLAVAPPALQPRPQHRPPQQPACCHLPLHHARVAMDEVSAQPRSLQCSTKKYKTISRWRC